MNRQTIAAHIATIIAMIFFGGAVAATRVAGRSIPPFSLAVLRFSLAGGVLLAVLFLLSHQRLKVRRPDWPLFIGMGLSFAAFAFCFNIGFRFTEASRGGLILATAPLWSALASRLMGWERLTARQVLGLFLTLGGIALVIAERGLQWQVGGRALLGDLLLLIGVIVGSVNGLLGKIAYRSYTALPVTTYTMLLASGLLLFAALPEGLLAVVSGFDGAQLILVLYLGLPAGALAYFMFFAALRHLTLTQSMVYININPLTATVLGAIVLGERLTGPFLIGFAVVLFGVLLVNLPKTLRLWPRPAADPATA